MVLFIRMVAPYLQRYNQHLIIYSLTGNNTSQVYSFVDCTSPKWHGLPCFALFILLFCRPPSSPSIVWPATSASSRRESKSIFVDFDFRPIIWFIGVRQFFLFPSGSWFLWPVFVFSALEKNRPPHHEFLQFLRDRGYALIPLSWLRSDTTIG